MPLTIPPIDNRKYQDLLDEALARIPVYTPEWTNFNKSDPGVTLVEVFAFLTESLLFRANQIPERNRKKFLTLLGVPLQPASSARGLVTFDSPQSRSPITLPAGVEVLAGTVPFRTDLGLDVLPVEAQVYYKRAVASTQQLVDQHNQLFAALRGDPPVAQLSLYQTASLPPPTQTGVDILADSVDGAVWIALLVPRDQFGNTPADQQAALDSSRRALAGRTLNVGWVPIPADNGRDLPPGAIDRAQSSIGLLAQIPVGGALPTDGSPREARYRALPTRASVDLLSQPGILEVSLPAAADLSLWTNLDPLEAGTRAFPPIIDDAQTDARVITWLKVTPAMPVPQATMRVLWVGANTATISQRIHVVNEVLPAGTGEPDQVANLTKSSVVPSSVQLTVTPAGGDPQVWRLIDDLLRADPEVPTPDQRQPPGTAPRQPINTKVFTLDAEAGVIRFGDGLRGARPPREASLRATYDYVLGAAGNVAAGAINAASALPAGVRVSNPVPTWGGAQAETVADGEKQVTRFIQHRDRLVNTTDFETLALRTPGAAVARVDVLPAFHPELGQDRPGDAPGLVTLMVVPVTDPEHPAAPRPQPHFLDAIACWLGPRRLVTTELFLRGPTYKGIFISAGIDVVAGVSIAQVVDAVRQAMIAFLSPLPDPTAPTGPSDPTAAMTTPQVSMRQRGWPLRRAVSALELMAVAARVAGVSQVNEVILAGADGQPTDRVTMSGLELPEIVGLSVMSGQALPMASVVGGPGSGSNRGSGSTADGGDGSDGSGQSAVPVVPVPIVPEECT